MDARINAGKRCEAYDAYGEDDDACSDKDRAWSHLLESWLYLRTGKKLNPIRLDQVDQVDQVDKVDQVKQLASALDETTASFSVSLRRTLIRRRIPILTLHATSSITKRVSPVTQSEGRFKI